MTTQTQHIQQLRRFKTGIKSDAQTIDELEKAVQGMAYEVQQAKETGLFFPKDLDTKADILNEIVINIIERVKDE